MNWAYLIPFAVMAAAALVLGHVCRRHVRQIDAAAARARAVLAAQAAAQAAARPGRPPALSPADRKYLAHVTRLAAGRPARTRRLGRDLADRLRQGSPAMADVELCAVGEHVLFFAARTRTEGRTAARDPADTYDALLDVLACAVADLGALALEPAP